MEVPAATVQQPSKRRSGPDCLPHACSACHSSRCPARSDRADHREEERKDECSLYSRTGSTGPQCDVMMLTLRPRACSHPSSCSIHQTAAEKNWLSAFDSDKSLRVAALAKKRKVAAGAQGHLQSSGILACIFALMLGNTVMKAEGNRAICASQSTARGLATTSATAGTPASFTIQVTACGLPTYVLCMDQDCARGSKTYRLRPAGK